MPSEIPRFADVIWNVHDRREHTLIRGLGHGDHRRSPSSEKQSVQIFQVRLIWKDFKFEIFIKKGAVLHVDPIS